MTIYQEKTMTSEPTIHVDEQAARREFLKQAGKAVAIAPAIALLLAASAKPASAAAMSGGDAGVYNP